MNLIGDITILLVSYCFMTFNILDVETNFMIGYAPVALTGLYILICLVVIVSGTTSIMRLRSRKYFMKRAYFRNRAKNPTASKFNREVRLERLKVLIKTILITSTSTHV